MRKFNFKENLKYGEQGEKETAELFRERGFTVESFYENVNTSAPMIDYGGIKFIAPDLKINNTFYVECKRKENWFYNKNLNITENGIDYEKWCEYMNLSEYANVNIYVNFIMKDGMWLINLEKKGRVCMGKNLGIDHWNSYNWNKIDFTKL